MFCVADPPYGGCHLVSVIHSVDGAGGAFAWHEQAMEGLDGTRPTAKESQISIYFPGTSPYPSADFPFPILNTTPLTQGYLYAGGFPDLPDKLQPSPTGGTAMYGARHSRKASSWRQRPLVIAILSVVVLCDGLYSLPSTGKARLCRAGEGRGEPFGRRVDVARVLYHWRSIYRKRPFEEGSIEKNCLRFYIKPSNLGEN